MSGFVQALDSYRSGNLTRDEILREVERELDTGEADSGTLLAALNQEQARERLPGNLPIELVRKLLHRRESPMAHLTSLGAPPPAPRSLKPAVRCNFPSSPPRKLSALALHSGMSHNTGALEPAAVNFLMGANPTV